MLSVSMSEILKRDMVHSSQNQDGTFRDSTCISYAGAKMHTAILGKVLIANSQC